MSATTNKQKRSKLNTIFALIKMQQLKTDNQLLFTSAAKLNSVS
jgi:hypothetical protein